MKRLYLTAIKRVLTEEAQKRLASFEDGEYNSPKDSNGNSLDFYIENNLRVPDELKEANSQQDYINFDLDKDYDTYEIEITVNMEDFVMAVDHEEIGSTIYLSNGNNVDVLEDNGDINAQIWWNTRSNWQRFLEFLKDIKSKISTTNK